MAVVFANDVYYGIAIEPAVTVLAVDGFAFRAGAVGRGLMTES
ncbi:MAG: hypothetical protein PHU25_09810 [Deltaproteobacteria bacterium]|nr:hypothetical protein [Deltaproteobacteria bacterium]